MAAAVEPRLIRERWEVVRVLGEGAFARTLLCTDRQGGRQVAIKQLRMRDVHGDWKVVELFEREARVLASLRHHGVPEVYEFFEADQALLLVQEFVEGQSLKERMDQGPLLGEIELVQVALGVLDILEYLHGRAPPVYHRDVKPSNIIIRPTGAPVLVDFGGVCFGWRPQSEGGSTIVGTYGYMPPEQLVGQVGPHSDLYALGATLLHVVSGRAPGDFPFDSGRIEVPADLPVRPALRELVRALLEPAPRDRPASARAAREILLRPEATALAVPPKTAIAPRGAPQFVDVGPPPRDPAGPFAQVYWHLVDIIGFSRIRSRGGKALAIVGWSALGLFTLGILPAVFHGLNRRRRRRYEPLFREGQLAEGTIVSSRRNQNTGFATFAYEYEVFGERYRALMDYEVKWMNVLMRGDRVAVLYDPADPTRSCFLVR